jgi:hypothetical protein
LILQTQLFAYADDIGIVGRSLAAIRDAYLALEAQAAKVGLKMNEQKTKYMIAGKNRTILDAGQTRRQEFRSRRRICVLGSSCDTKKRSGFGDTVKNPDCK